MNLVIYSVQVLLVIAAAAAGMWSFRPAIPRARLAYWRAVVLLCLLLPVFPMRRADDSNQTMRVPTFEVETNARTAGAAASSIEWLPWIVAVGATLRGAWLALGLARLRRLRHQSEPALLDDEVTELHRRLAPHARLQWHEGLSQPVTFGFRQPVVLLPLRLRRLSPELQRAIVCHELLHVVRRDWLWTVVEEVVRSVFWFHPAMRWALTQTQSSREQTVDARAVATTGGRVAYVRALMEFADGGAPAPAAPFVRRRQLARRIREISREVHMSPLRVAISGTALLVVLVASSLAVMGAVPLQRNVAPSNADAARLVPGGPPPPVVHKVKPAYPPAASQGPVRVGGAVGAPRKIFDVAPIYPEDAAAADVQGVVILDVTIAKDGSVADATIRRSIPMLDQASLDAVRQWRFTPTVHDGAPIDVLMTVTVNFTLSR